MKVSKDDKLWAIAVYLQHTVTFKPERSKAYAPPEHTVFYKMWRNGKLNQNQCIAASILYDDALKAAGSSKGLTTAYNERVDASSSGRAYDPRVSENASAARIRDLWDNVLHSHEKELVIPIIKEFNTSSKVEIDLRALGSIITGYNDAAQARSAGTALIQSFLNTLVEYYGLKQ